MSSPDNRSIVIRVEVEISGGGQGGILRRVKIVPELTSVSVPSGTAKVRDSGGGFGYICATGNSTKGDDDVATSVYAKVYPAGTTDFPATPPNGADGATGTIPEANGNWIFSGNLDIPKAAHNAGGTAGNILYIWAKYPDGSYETKQRSFTGKTSTGTDCVAGPGSGGGAVLKQPRTTAGLAIAGKPLHATFLGTLASLGCIALHWNGVYWMGMVPATGAHLSFFAAETNCTLGCSGEGIAFMVAGPPTAFCPFNWSGEGTLSGKKPGGFGVIVTE